jgi:hypothetical protein
MRHCNSRVSCTRAARRQMNEAYSITRLHPTLLGVIYDVTVENSKAIICICYGMFGCGHNERSVGSAEVGQSCVGLSSALPWESEKDQS